jgi:XTP/dITP diphosphohydrolase
MLRLLIATNNAGKVEEFRELLEGSGWEIVAPSDLGLDLDVEESGSTYAENARLKAEAFSRASGLPAMADDSGLEVDDLNGEPGALHHVNGWDGRDQDERIQILLDAMDDVSPPLRTARFRSVIVVVFPDGRVIEEEGAVEGVIAPFPAGEGGFGYDPVFLPQGSSSTMAQLSASEKNRISHRSVAARRLVPQLRELAARLSRR